MRKTAIVTGGSRGIGLAIARQLAGDGYNIAILATREKEACREALDALESEQAKVLYVQGNVEHREDRERLVLETVQAFGAIHILVNNAGVAPKTRGDLLEMSEESWDRVLDINLKAAMFLTQAVAMQMLRQESADGRRGTIINISSVSAEFSSVNRGEYCVSKAGVSMLTKLYAHRLAGDGIYVHEIRPGIIETDMTGGVHARYDAMIRDGAFPIARWGTPQDIAKAVSALASEQFSYSTGNCIEVDGGFHIRRL